MVGVESDRVGGETDSNIMVAEPWNAQNKWVVTKLCNEGMKMLMMTVYVESEGSGVRYGS